MQNNTIRYIAVIALGNILGTIAVPPATSGRRPISRALQGAKKGAETLRSLAQERRKKQQAQQEEARQQVQKFMNAPSSVVVPIADYGAVAPVSPHVPQGEDSSIKDESDARSPYPTYASYVPPATTHTATGHPAESEYDKLSDAMRQQNPHAAPYQSLDTLQAKKGEEYANLPKAIQPPYANVPQHVLEAEAALRNLLSLGSTEMQATTRQNDALYCILSNNANPNTQATEDSGGNTLLHMFAQQGKADFIAQLLGLSNIEINIENSSGRTALHQAILFGQTEVAKQLIRAGADPQCADSQGRTALRFAQIRKNEELIGLLQQATEQ